MSLKLDFFFGSYIHSRIPSFIAVAKKGKEKKTKNPKIESQEMFEF
jgi:hypothetical protein